MIWESNNVVNEIVVCKWRNLLIIKGYVKTLNRFVPHFYSAYRSYHSVLNCTLRTEYLRSRVGL